MKSSNKLNEISLECVKRIRSHAQSIVCAMTVSGLNIEHITVENMGRILKNMRKIYHHICKTNNISSQ